MLFKENLNMLVAECVCLPSGGRPAIMPSLLDGSGVESVPNPQCTLYGGVGVCETLGSREELLKC